MDRRQKKRIVIFLLVPILAAFLFVTDDLLIRVIIITLIIIYVAFIIFLRDSVRFQGGYSISEDESEADSFAEPKKEFEESFKIISKTKDAEVLSSQSLAPDFPSKVTLKPPDLKEKFQEIANEQFPKGIEQGDQFAFALEKMLTVIKEAYEAYSAIFFWYNKKKDKLIIEKFVSNSTDLKRRKFDIEDDILSKIVERGEPELLSEIPSAAEADVIRYYDTTQGIRSFVGVPLFYDNSLIAILAVDSKDEDAFGIETIYSLGRFVRVITMIITIFEEKYSDTVSQKRLQGILKLLSPDNDYENEEELLSAVQSAAESFLSWDAFVFVYYDPVEKVFVTKKVSNTTSLKYIGEGLKVKIKGTLVGKAIRTGLPVKVDDTTEGKVVRFSKQEDLSFEGSFLAVPLVYKKQIFGVLCFENLKKSAFTTQDVQFLKNSLNILAFIIYSHSTRKLLESLTSIDIETRALNEQEFKERFLADLIKAKEVNAPGALALIKIDDFIEQESLFDGDPLPRVVTSIANVISKELSYLNLFGRLDERLFAISFFNADAKKVFVWAEKLRVKIARQPITVVSKQSTFTVSIGIASTTHKTDVSELLEKANLALQKAVEKGGNSVQNIN